MKRIALIAYIAMCAALSAFSGAEFEEDRLTFTASINPVWSLNQFDYINTSVPDLGPKDEAEYFLDHIDSAGILAECLAAYQFDVYYLGATAFATADMKTSGTYDIQISRYMGQNYWYENEKPFDFRSEAFGAGIEFGSRYLLLGGYNRSVAISGPIFHNGVAFGLAYRQWHSNLEELNGIKPGYFVSFRSQFLLFEGIGINLLFNTLFDDDLNANMILGGGVFVGI